jgi:hypothetical protein
MIHAFDDINLDAIGLVIFPSTRPSSRARASPTPTLPASPRASSPHFVALDPRVARHATLAVIS